MIKEIELMFENIKKSPTKYLFVKNFLINEDYHPIKNLRNSWLYYDINHNKFLIMINYNPFNITHNFIHLIKKK